MSGCKAVIAGPDLLPIVFAQLASESIEQQLGDDPSTLEQQLLPSSLVAMIFGNLVTGVITASIEHGRILHRNRIFEIELLFLGVFSLFVCGLFATHRNK